MQTHLNRSPEAGTIPATLLRQDRRRKQALARLRKLRQQARDEIERLIQFLDESELDPDLEDCGDFEPDADDEPSLGSLTSSAAAGDQNRWGLSEATESDLEQEHDGREPSLCGITVETSGDSWDLEHEDEDEPSLGWTLDGRFGGDRDFELNEVLA